MLIGPFTPYFFVSFEWNQVVSDQNLKNKQINGFKFFKPFFKRKITLKI